MVTRPGSSTGGLGKKFRLTWGGEGVQWAHRPGPQEGSWTLPLALDIMGQHPGAHSTALCQ